MLSVWHLTPPNIVFTFHVLVKMICCQTPSFLTNHILDHLFKSQNASTWEPSQWEDLKFTLYRADFIESGSVEFYSPELTKGNQMIPRLLPDSLVLNSKKIRCGLGTTTGDTGYEIGNTFFQLGTQASGDLVGVAAEATGLSVANPGIGYTPLRGLEPSLVSIL